MADTVDNSSITPEKRLLDLIEEPSAHADEPTITTKKKKFFSLDDIKAKFSELGRKNRNVIEKYQKSFGIKEINKVLGGVVWVMIFIFAVVFIHDFLELREDFSISVNPPDVRTFDTDTQVSAASKNDSVSEWDLGKIFMPYGKRQEEAERQQKAHSDRLAEMTQKLKLTGISYNPADPSKAFCMIEDLEKGITIFLREADPIGLLRVSKIYEDRVVLEQGNETVELR